jgi:hypothetical protein
MSSGPVARFDHPGEKIAVDPDRGCPPVSPRSPCHGRPPRADELFAVRSSPKLKGERVSSKREAIEARDDQTGRSNETDFDLRLQTVGCLI